MKNIAIFYLRPECNFSLDYGRRERDIAEKPQQ